MIGTLTTAAASPLSARLTRLRKRRLLMSSLSSAMPQLLDPAVDAPDHQHQAKRGQDDAGKQAEAGQRRAGAYHERPDGRGWEMDVLIVHAITPPGSTGTRR